MRDGRKYAATAAATSAYGVPELADWFYSRSEGNLQEASSPLMERQRQRDAITRAFTAHARQDQAGTSDRNVPSGVAVLK